MGFHSVLEAVPVQAHRARANYVSGVLVGLSADGLPLVLPDWHIAGKPAQAHRQNPPEWFCRDWRIHRTVIAIRLATCAIAMQSHAGMLPSKRVDRYSTRQYQGWRESVH
jgi:hypothetical protein